MNEQTAVPVAKPVPTTAICLLPDCSFKFHADSLEDARKMSIYHTKCWGSSHNCMLMRTELLEMEKKSSFTQAINDFCKLAHQRSTASGFYTYLPTGKLREFSYGEKIALIHSELSESLEGDRKDLMDDKLPHRKSAELELADAMIRIADLAGAMGFDLGGAIEEKMEYNLHRADHKPENRILPGGKKY